MTDLAPSPVVQFDQAHQAVLGVPDRGEGLCNQPGALYLAEGLLIKPG